MVGDRQTPSGTPFDPLPQFYVYEWTPAEDSWTILGRCFFAPVRVGSRFDRMARNTASGWQEVGSCDLEVIDISIFQGVMVDTLDQVYNARITAKGRLPTDSNGTDHLLIAPASSLAWAWDGRLWVTS